VAAQHTRCSHAKALLNTSAGEAHVSAASPYCYGCLMFSIPNIAVFSAVWLLKV
jgi:hypothetical protein